MRAPHDALFTTERRNSGTVRSPGMAGSVDLPADWHPCAFCALVAKRAPTASTVADRTPRSRATSLCNHAAMLVHRSVCLQSPTETKEVSY